MTDPAHPDAPTRDRAAQLREIERRRRGLWIAAAIVITSLGALATLSLVADAETRVDNPALRWGALAISGAFVVYLFEQERVTRRLLRRLFDEGARLESLETFVAAARAVNSTLEPEQVLRVMLESAMQLLGGTTGAVHVRVGEDLKVVAAQGTAAVDVGHTVPIGVGVVGAAAQSRAPAHAPAAEGGVPGLSHGQANGPVLVTPIDVSGRVVGTLAVQRPTGAEPFGAAELQVTTLLSEHAATAITNATRYDRERRRVDELVAATEQRADFIRAMVHDLRTPLSALLGYATVLNDRGDRLTDSQRAQAAAGVVGQGERLQRMIGEVLDAGKAEAGGDLDRGPVDILALLGETREVVEQAATSRGTPRKIRLVAPADPVTVAADEEALRHVFTNLVENAVKYSPPDTPIVLTLELHDTEAVIHVTDHGEGIPADKLPHVFERFRQTGQNRAGGVGLGLYIVRALTQAHGGRVWVNSTVGEGTTFSIGLPLIEEPATPS